MCGICGFVDFRLKGGVEVLTKMVATLHHRGPDDSGCEVFATKHASVGFGHTRLSILDLSPAGHQPMHYENLNIVLNGEIYNFAEIKKDLLGLGHNFKSESDTEVVLHAFLEWGGGCVSRFNGMFAFVVYDRDKSELTMVRDRAGVKPLFYYWHDGLLLFGSELKPFLQHPNFIKEIDVNAVAQYMDFGYIPSPYCIFKHCAKLDPGHILTFSIKNKEYKAEKYWDVNDFYTLPKLGLTYHEAVSELEKLLHSAFEYRMVSDVPVGVFLSGGYDSTAVAAMLQSRRTEKLKTFTIGFEEGINEAPFAKAIAQHIGTDHTEYFCTSKEAQEIIPQLPYFFDEPYADSSAIPTMLISSFSVKNVTVALSADAGDEIFAGYSTYKCFLNDLARINKIPTPLRALLGSVLRAGKLVVPEKQEYLRLKLEVLSKVLKKKSELAPVELLRNYPLYKLGDSIKNGLLNAPFHEQKTAYDFDFSGFEDNLSKALAIDYKMYLQNDILTKVDRATMSVSLEGREPFLDHRIIEFAAQLPNEYKYGVTQKRILRDIVHKYVPKSLLDRPKAGFSIPIYSWLKTDLKFLLEEFLDPREIEKAGLFVPGSVKAIKDRFLNGALYDPTIVWKILQFQFWHKKWMQ